MDNIAGSPVEGDDFFGREVELRTLWETLQKHDVLLLGPRRIGKTSIARALRKRASGADWHEVEVNVASCDDERCFVEKLAKEVERAALSKWESAARDAWDGLTKRFDRIKSVKIAGQLGIDLKDTVAEEDWTAVASDTLRLIARPTSNGDAAVPLRWLIYLDELPIFLYNLIENNPADGVQRVRRFLDWFRNDVRNIPECRQVRWLVTGSVGLDTLVQRYRMADTINSLKHETLPAFSHEQAVAMLLALANSYPMLLTDADATDIVGAIQWPQPYYLQLVFFTLRRLFEAEMQPVATLIPIAVEKSLQQGGDTDNDFMHWEERLEMQLGREDAFHARALLIHAARNPLGERPEMLLAGLQQRMPDDDADAQRQKFIELRDILIRDAYWWSDESGEHRRLRFRLELLRRWWIRRNDI